MNYDIANSQQMQQPEQQQMQNIQEEKTQNTENKMKDNNSSISGTSKKRERLTPEKLAELQRNFPGIDWAHDTIMEEGEEGMKDHVDIQVINISVSIPQIDTIASPVVIFRDAICEFYVMQERQEFSKSVFICEPTCANKMKHPFEILLFNSASRHYITSE